MSNFVQKIKDKLTKGITEFTGEGGDDMSQPLEGNAALKAGLPADPGEIAGVKQANELPDLLFSGLAAKATMPLARGITAPASELVGNSVGSIGSNISTLIKKPNPVVEAAKALKIQLEPAPIVRAGGVPMYGAKATSTEAPGIIQDFQNKLGMGDMSTQKMFSNAANIVEQGEKRGIPTHTIVSPELVQALQERYNRELVNSPVEQALLKRKDLINRMLNNK